MKLRLSILLLAAALAASPAAGQTIKSLGYNTTNGFVTYSGTNTLTFTNALQFSTNARAATRTNLGGTTVGNAVFTATNAAAAATAIGLGTTNAVTFGTLTAELLQVRVGTNLYVGLADDVSEFWTDVAVNRELSVDDLATFSTNVTVNGNLSVGSLTTTTPSTWALDATQTAADTNGILALPSNANVIRLTNNTAISGVSGGVLGAFYYLVNQTTNAVTISNVGGITVQGGTSLTLGANQAATLVATGATNASVAARGDLNNVTLTGDTVLSGVNNTMPGATNAASGASLMTRDLVDNRSLNYAINSFPHLRFSSITAAGGTVLDTPWNTGVYTAATTNAIAHGRLMFPIDSMQFGNETTPNKFWLFTRVSLFFNTNNALDTVTFGDAGGTNTVQYPLEDGTSTNPAYVSYGTNFVNEDNRFAIQLRHNSTNIQARLISMRPGSPSGVYSETAWTNVAVAPSLSTLAERPLLIALQRNNTNVIAYAAQATGVAQAYIDANSLQVIGSATIESGGYNPTLGFRAVSKSGALMRVEFMNTQAVVTP